MSVSQTELKEMVKAAMAETLVEQRALLREIVEEVIEDIALSRAIDEGNKTALVSRDEVFGALESQ